jgi:hypothetical protein
MNLQIIRRIARIWSAIVIGFGILIFIGEVIEAATTELAPYPFYENIIPFTLLTAVVGLALAWRWEGLGAIVNIVSVIINFVTYLFTGREAWVVVLLILTPVLIPGILFLVCWFYSRRKLGDAQVA